MHYYSVSYKTLPAIRPAYLPDDVEDFQQAFLFGHLNKLGGKGIELALVSYLKDKNIAYDQLLIIESKEITEKEYNDSTRYS